ncbi:hypothetical protein BJ912DRAFT_843347, partial [Pholiota molesta]
MSLKATSLVFLIAAFAVLAPVKSAPALAARQASSSSSTATTTTLSASSTSTSTGTSATATSTNSIHQNALAAQQLNVQYATLSANASCTDGQLACITSQFAQCEAGAWVLTPCSANLTCFAVPSTSGSALVCDTPADATLRFEQAGVSGG